MSIQDSLTGGGNIIGDLIGGIGNTFDAIGDVFAFLTSAEGWRRIFEILFGAVLVFGALRYGN